MLQLVTAIAKPTRYAGALAGLGVYNAQRSMRYSPIMPKTSLQLLMLIAASWSAAAVDAQEAVPFRTRNLSPLIAIFGLPAWDVPTAPFELSYTSELANHYRLSQRGPELLILDGETWRNSLFLSKSIGEGWSVSLELPHYRVGGGVLDDVIDGWHSTFRLPDGGRNNRPADQVQFELGRDNSVFYELDEGASGSGDVQLGVAYALGRDNGLHVRATVKLPTGDERILAGSGSTDWAVTMLRTRPVTLRSRAAGYFWGIGILRLGRAELLRYDQERNALIGVVGGSMKVSRNIGLKVQLDAHDALFNSLLEEIGERSFQATLGGWWTFSQRGVLDFGVNEDLEVSTSPDVVLHLNARWRFGVRP
jgi:hypothetical protein